MINFFIDKRDAVASLSSLLIILMLSQIFYHINLDRNKPATAKNIQLSLVSIPNTVKDKSLEKPIAPTKPKPIKKQIQPSINKAFKSNVTSLPRPEVSQPQSITNNENKTKPTLDSIKKIISNSESEGLFTKDVKSRIEINKHYPETAMRLGMVGTVEVSYVIKRNGELISVKVINSSGYKLLDEAAINAVKSSVYKPFPTDAWVGENQKEFHTIINFNLDN